MYGRRLRQPDTIATTRRYQCEMKITWRQQAEAGSQLVAIHRFAYSEEA
jgi:hypothetical protein